MCEECRQSPCHRSCPNAEEPKKIGTCHICKDTIYESDAHCNVSGYNGPSYEEQMLCMNCVEVIY